MKVFGCMAYAHIRQDKLQLMALKCIFLGYPKGVKGYKLWCLEPGYKRCINSRDVVFNEFEMENLVKKESVGIIGKHIARIAVENNDEQFEVEPEPGQQDESQGEVQENTQKQSKLEDYSLTRERARRVIKPPKIYVYVDLLAFTFIIADDTNDEEPKIYSKAMSSSDKENWLSTMKEDMKSFMENET